ncbi:MAG: amino acid permease [Enterobacterales bacterium]|nr:amino acid permease [Enterobacterales bacterium]
MSENTPPKKPFGLAITTSMIIGIMIGSGIFLLPASLAEFGAWSFYGWLFTALGALCLAWVFARLSSWHPGLGGPYYYSRIGVGDFGGFLVAWGYWVSIWVGNAAIAIGAASYISLLFPVLAENKLLVPMLAITILWLLTAINIKGVKEAGYVQLLTTVLKTVPLLIFGLVGIWHIDIEMVTQPPETEISIGAAIFASSALWLWAFLGVESASIPSDNIDDPKKTIPRATIIGVILVASIYLLTTTVIFGTMSHSELANSAGPYADAAGKMWGNWASIAIIIVAVISSLGALNGLILLGGQMPRAAAEDRLFPKLFAKLNKNNSPATGILISGVLSSILILLNISDSTIELFNFSILLSTTSLLVPYIFCSAVAIRLQPKNEPLITRISIIIFALAFVFSIWALGGAGQEAVYWGFLLMMLSVPIYILIKHQNDLEDGEIHD